VRAPALAVSPARWARSVWMARMMTARQRPSAAGRAKAPTLAGERDKVFVAAAVTLQAHKAVLESSAAQVVLELGQHESRQWHLVTLQFIPQGRQMLFDDGIERRVLRLMALVAVACADDPVAGNSFHRRMMAGEDRRSQRSIAGRCVRYASQSHGARLELTLL